MELVASVVEEDEVYSGRAVGLDVEKEEEDFESLAASCLEAQRLR